MVHEKVEKLAIAVCGLMALAFGQYALAQPADLPPIPDLSGKVLTVTGPVDPAAIGQTLMHEHVFIHFEPTHPRPRRKMSPEEAIAYQQPLSLANLYNARYGSGVEGTDTIGNFNVVYNEVMEFKKWDGGTIVDVSSIGLSRDPVALQHMSRVTGLNIVMGGGYYTKGYYPTDMDQRSVEDLTAIIVRDIVVGVNGTNIRTGIIGEVGINGRPLTDNEIKSVRASARASRLTGAPITFHYGGRNEEKFRVLDVVASEGADLSHVVMGHSGPLWNDLPFMLRLVKLGVTIEFDWLGALSGQDAFFDNPTDLNKAQGVAALVKAGYADQIVLGHDICTPTQLKAYGGNGYSFISEYFLPELRRLGVSEADIHKIMVENPRRILTFTKPRPVVDHH